MNRIHRLYRKILFDLDGTLTDSGPGIINSVSYALNKYGIRANNEELTAMIGPPLQQSFQIIYGFSNEKASEAVEYYREYFREKGMFENQLYPGITEMLKELFENNRQLYLATSKPTVFARQILQHFKIEYLFDQVVGSNLDGSRVVKPEIIGAVSELTGGLSRDETVMVGDREHDIIGAKAHELDTIAVTYGYGSLEELKSVQPTVVVSSVAELSELLLEGRKRT